jgi:hypothetical protein
MSKALKPEAPRMGGVVFELERFEFGEGNRWRLRGRWFGVRGRRFMRPTLTLIGQGRRTRLLADLEHKPWGAEDGELWEVVFEGTLRDPELVDAELTVAPDITITLPTPQGKRPAEHGPATRRAPSLRPDRGAQPAGRGAKALQKPQEAEDVVSRGRLALLTRQLVEAQNEVRRLRRQLAGAEAEKADAVARVDALLGELDALKRARDEAEESRVLLAAERDAAQSASAAAQEASAEARAACDSALEERDAAVAARDRAASEREAALAEQDDAVSQRDAAVAARDRAASEREAALAQRDEAVSQRDAAVAAREASLSERDAALTARDEATSQRDEFKATSERLRSELADLRASSGAALVMRQAARTGRRSRYHGAVKSAVAIIGALIVALVVLTAIGVL